MPQILSASTNETPADPVSVVHAGEATYNVFPIARTAYRPFDSTPYLPGSSLKGSIRTAWLNHVLSQRGNPLKAEDSRDKNKARTLQERLLGYAAGKFENDPFRHLGLADAHPEDDVTPPPTRVLYAISKKKRLPREGERSPQELKTFLETIPDALPAAFLGELRLSGKIGWNELCDACNRFYQPQLKAELAHAVLGTLLDADWQKLVKSLLDNELADLIKARQGFLLRVGRNSGAESVTLDGVRDIKILGARVEGKQTFDFRSKTTEKRFASLSKAGAGNLLPFGWLSVNAATTRTATCPTDCIRNSPHAAARCAKRIRRNSCAWKTSRKHARQPAPRPPGSSRPLPQRNRPGSNPRPHARPHWPRCRPTCVASRNSKPASPPAPNNCAAGANGKTATTTPAPASSPWKRAKALTGAPKKKARRPMPSPNGCPKSSRKSTKTS